MLPCDPDTKKNHRPKGYVMNPNEVSTPRPPPERQIPFFGLSCNLKVFLAAILGVLSFFLLVGLGELFLESGKFSRLNGEVALFASLGAYFLIAQFTLSRGNPQPLRRTWPKIIALNFLPLLAAPICLVIGTHGARLSVPWLALFTVACSYAGAALAARLARNRTPDGLIP
jgi:hypothetical protein